MTSVLSEEKMDSIASSEERRKYPRYSIELPLEYWQTDDALHGGMVGNLSDGGLLIYSARDIPTGRELNVRVFFPNGYEFDGIRIIGKIVWKQPHYDVDWTGYGYGFEFTQILEQDRQKLMDLLRGPSTLEEIFVSEDTIFRNPSPEESVSFSALGLESCQMNEPSRNCLWDRFKTNIFHLLW